MEDKNEIWEDGQRWTQRSVSKPLAFLRAAEMQETCILLHYFSLCQEELAQGDTDVVPLTYHVRGHELKFGREEFCLVTGLRFGIEFKDFLKGRPTPFRRCVFSSEYDGCNINVGMVYNKLYSEDFDKLSDNDAVRLSLVGLLVLVLLGREYNYKVDNWIWSLVDNLDAWNMYPWGSVVWRTLYAQLAGACDKRLEAFYGKPRPPPDDKGKVKNPKYTLQGFQWALRTNECDCRKWQLSGIPCGHVIAVSRFLGQTNCLKYVQYWFKKEKYQATYAESIQFVGNYKEWEYPDHIHPVTPPIMNNPQPGHPKNTDRILSQGEEPTRRHCSRCNEVGHTRLRCNKSFVPDPPVRKDTHATNHYDQPFDHTQYASQSYYHNEYPSQQYDPNHYDQPFDHTQYASQSYYHNEYPSQQYDPNTNASQTYDQYHTQPSFNMSQPNETQTFQNDHQSSSHLYDHNTQGSNSWFNHFGF
ncbi:phospholipase-like protein [Artemisia annua]|uniref:Phospholipase-like protein n=1 Tax=Artemisia annua TaxID=35608 RepID=A0A2U1PHJ2_ARTAN|nr:phospholipase-like protein [Artemisia annua]